MTQSVLLDKFSIYLELKKTEIGSQYDPQLIDNLIKDFNDHGFCFGFALSYAIMNYLEKLALWRAMLVAAYSWNGKPNTLKSNYELPGRKKLALNDIFEELIQAVTFYQTGNPVHSFLNEEAFWSEFDYRLAHSVPSIDFNSFSQRNILGVGVHFLEIDNGVGQLKHIQADARIEDQFSLEALTDTLDEEVIKGCICIVFSEKHAISVIYNEPFWQVYDANYSHASAVKLAKFFSNKEEVAKEIISILGNELTIKLASLDQKIEIKLKEWTESFETFKQEVYQDLLAIKNNDLSYFISRLQVHKDILDLTALEVFIFYCPKFGRKTLRF